MASEQEKKAHVSEWEIKRIMEIVRHKSFLYIDRSLKINILEGLELHENIFGDFSQKMLLEEIFELQEKGEKRLLHERTYLKPKSWMQGK
eukprot:Gb_29609 [translate_table: standard]